MPYPIIELKDINKSYNLGRSRNLLVLKNINLTVTKGDFIAIMGPSGSGKSTLMNIVGFLDQPDSGHYFLEGQDTTTLSKKWFPKFRNKKVGFIFQSYNLLPRYSVYKNILLPLVYGRVHFRKRKEKTMAVLKSVGLLGRFNHKPNELSGGEAQRAAIARALVNQPEILLADEPTGNLDTKTGQEIMKIIKESNEKGTTVLLVTHDSNIAKWANKTILMIDGEIKENQK